MTVKITGQKLTPMENQVIRNIEEEILSNKKYQLKNVNFEYHTETGDWEKQSKEIYDAGNSVAVLLYNADKGTVILNRQFRIASFLNGNQNGIMLETCAGKIDGSEQPEETLKREVREETGYEINEAKKIFQAYMSPGAYTELVHFFIASCDQAMRTDQGGGKKEEHEHIEVLEMPFEKIFGMIQTGEINDAKTILLLQYARLNNLFSAV